MTLRRLKLSDLFGGLLPAKAPAAGEPPSPTPHGGAIGAESVLRTLNALYRRLERILNGLREHASADTELRAIAGELACTVRRDPDIALATVLLNQIAGAYGVRHCLETAIVAVLVARKMGKSDAELALIVAAALTMNAGMVRRAEVFDGREGALTNEERALVARHPRDSVNLLRWAGIDDEKWLSYVLLHHEKEDGSGYPEGRMGQEIAENASLIGTADRYCAMVSARDYRRSLLPPVAMDRLAAQTPPCLAQAFHAAVGAWPPGTLVRLASGDVGVVVGRAAADSLRICTLATAGGAALPAPVHRLTGEDGCAIDEAVEEDSARLRFTMQQVWGELAAL